MNFRLKTTFCAIVWSLAMVASGVAHAATAEVTDMDPDLQAKVAKERAKQTVRGQVGGDSVGGSDSKCGEINIGNDSPSKSASQKMADRQKTVIVTGPVIGAAKCR